MLLANKIRKRVPFATQSSLSLASSIKAFPTVCEHSHCPNQAECFHHGIATFLAMGEVCTRSCRYCSIQHGRPAPLDSEEKFQLTAMVEKLGLRHAVITSVDRDDLPDGGAQHLAEIAHHLHTHLPVVKLEFLLPEFRGNPRAWESIASAPIDIFSHNMETVPNLFPIVRPQGNWQQSLDFLEYLGKFSRTRMVKSGFMLGLGESIEEALHLMSRLKAAGVSILTIGQYLPPTADPWFAKAFPVSDQTFQDLRLAGLKMGFSHIFSGSFVRSSYLADQVWKEQT